MREDLLSLVRLHLKLHPGFGSADLAKLLYQGVMGMDHLLGDRERFIRALEEEWEGLGPVALAGEVLLEPVHPVDPIARLNLRPAKGAGLCLADLAPLFADQPPRGGRLEDLLTLWNEASALAREGRIPFREAELDRWGEVLRSGKHLPGHSAQYRELNRPAYRLVHNAAGPRWREVLAPVGRSADLP
ncbi:MAG: hypothetical protein BIP78_1388 [Candidatus Bipolaricaulis sibiricus]|uniref:Uncharacterized protein n=1 Tax=Bipolaricaulis sibiricus TaxID=2501609 RepID=A0A410FVX2_BIPS1|nr:MAG: hypothetical protein BIP78_1388 [Candidatus Bipolaricaulis sibiricus]